MASREALFCPQTGALLELDAARGIARCPLSGWQRSLAGEHAAAREAELSCFCVYSHMHSLRGRRAADLSNERVVSRTDIYVRALPRSTQLALSALLQVERHADSGLTAGVSPALQPRPAGEAGQQGGGGAAAAGTHARHSAPLPRACWSST